MHFVDLELLKYHAGPFHAENWSTPLLAVGWLQYPQEFQTGAVSDLVITKLKNMVIQVRAAYAHYSFRGIMYCSFCRAANLPSPGPIWSQENLFVPGENAVYVAPGGVVHYIEQHSYLPASEFLDAAIRCPDLQTREYQDALRTANHGAEPPLETAETFDQKPSKFRRP